MASIRTKMEARAEVRCNRVLVGAAPGKRVQLCIAAVTSTLPQTFVGAAVLVSLGCRKWRTCVLVPSLRSTTRRASFGAHRSTTAARTCCGACSRSAICGSAARTDCEWTPLRIPPTCVACGWRVVGGRSVGRLSLPVTPPPSLPPGMFVLCMRPHPQVLWENLETTGACGRLGPPAACPDWRGC